MQRNLLHLVNCLSGLPGIGRRSAMRIALSFLNQDKGKIMHLCSAIQDFCHEMHFCSLCGNLQLKDATLCDICLNQNRNNEVVCVVENIVDLMAIENTQEFNGLYHVLGGVLSPLNGVSPENLRLDSLVQRVEGTKNSDQNIKEILLATNPTLEGDATAHYIYDMLSKGNQGSVVLITRIQHGLASGQNIEYADHNLLAHSIRERKKLYP